MDLPSATIIIATFSSERRRYLRRAIASMRAQTIKPREIIVVVDYNPALLAQLRAEHSDVLVIENIGARGASGARNTGVQRASGEIVAFIDDDVVASPTWLERLLHHYGDEQVMGVGGVIAPLWARRQPAWFPAEFNWVLGCTYPGLPETAAPVRNLIAANMSVHRDLFLQMGGFRRGFGKVGARPRPEETELCIRISQRRPSGIWLYAPDALVQHYVPPSRARIRFFLARCYSEGAGKAALARLVGSGDSLRSERSFVRRTLPIGVIRGLAQFASGQDRAGLARSVAILAGVSVAAAGYVLDQAVSTVRAGADL